MPKLTGKKVEETLLFIDKIGLQHRIITRATGTPLPGAERTVIHQKPGAGSPVAMDTMVDIVVNR